MRGVEKGEGSRPVLYFSYSSKMTRAAANIDSTSDTEVKVSASKSTAETSSYGSLFTPVSLEVPA